MVTLLNWVFLLSPSCNPRITSHSRYCLPNTRIFLPFHLRDLPSSLTLSPGSSFSCKPQGASFCLNPSCIWKLNPALLDPYLQKLYPGPWKRLLLAKSVPPTLRSRFYISAVVSLWCMYSPENSGCLLGTSFIIFCFSSCISYRLELFPLLSLWLINLPKGPPCILRCMVIHFPLHPILSFMASATSDPNMLFPHFRNSMVIPIVQRIKYKLLNVALTSQSTSNFPTRHPKLCPISWVCLILFFWPVLLDPRPSKLQFVKN